jgi:2-polyprenyl-6-methoxyphenol hydroxylase-like FAD-dependent oxidoreductase
VRKAADISFLGETWDEEHFLLGNVSVSGLDTHFTHTWGTLNGGLTLQWMSHSTTWFFVAPIAPDEQGSVPALTLESLQRLFDERAGMPGVHLSNPRWLSVWRPNIRMVDRYRAGRIFLAGDAAHVHSAAGGQGLNTGVQDAYNLGWKLAQVLGGAPDALLDTYQAERLPVAEGVLTTTSMRHREFQRDFSQAVNTLIAGKETFADPSRITSAARARLPQADTAYHAWDFNTFAQHLRWQRSEEELAAASPSSAWPSPPLVSSASRSTLCRAA